MKSPLDSLMETQKMVFDYWKTAADNLNPTSVNEKKPVEDFASMWEEWFENQKKLWEDVMGEASLSEAYKKAPDKMHQWMSAQNEALKTWYSFFSNGNSFEMDPGKWNQEIYKSMMKQGTEQMTKWATDTTTGAFKELISKLPESQQANYENFKSMYGSLNAYWANILKMAQHGISDWKGINQFFPVKVYEQMITNSMGMKTFENVEEMIQQSNQMMDHISALVKKNMEQVKTGTNIAGQLTESFYKGDSESWFDSLLSMHEEMKKGMDGYLNLSGGTGKNQEILKVLNDIRFLYTAYLLKSAQYQNTILSATKDALPKSIKSLEKLMADGKTDINFETFFADYVNELDTALVEMMKSKDYAKLQAGLAKSSTTMKGKLDQLSDLWLEDSPFLSSGFANEVAKENAALRRKIRSVESRLRALEKAKAPTNGSVRRTKSTTTKKS